MLKVSGLRRHFGGVWAANGIDLRVAPGELHALIGPNGAGKTTLIHLISGAVMADHGSVTFANQDLTRLSMHERATLGLVRSYQITSIFPHLSTEENVCLAVQARQRDWGSSFRFWRPAARDTAIVAEAHQHLALVGLTARARTPAADLSHGEQRCLELAMALATRPRLLLLDEPMAGMAPDESTRMADLLASLKGKLAMVLVEHDMDIVFRLADRLSVLVAGRIVASGEPAIVRDDPEVRRAYLGDEVVPL
jgi:branched-chain amino acid transport system ATP-binding protein